MSCKYSEHTFQVDTKTWGTFGSQCFLAFIHFQHVWFSLVHHLALRATIHFTGVTNSKRAQEIALSKVLSQAYAREQATSQIILPSKIQVTVQRLDPTIQK